MVVAVLTQINASQCRATICHTVHGLLDGRINSYPSVMEYISAAKPCTYCRYEIDLPIVSHGPGVGPGPLCGRNV
jgi:hypothetical protein